MGYSKLHFDRRQIKSFTIDPRLSNNSIHSRFDPVIFRGILFVLLRSRKVWTNLVCLASIVFRFGLNPIVFSSFLPSLGRELRFLFDLVCIRANYVCFASILHSFFIKSVRLASILQGLRLIMFVFSSIQQIWGLLCLVFLRYCKQY
jgi:hypothetical protein